MISSNRTILVLMILLAGSLRSASAQEQLTIPPTPTDRDYKTKEQIRRDWTVLCEKARSDALRILKASQHSSGAWVPTVDWWGEDVSPLVIEALLDQDVPRSDRVIIKGLKNLRSYRPGATESVALQTIALCKANEKNDRKLVERNVEWLVNAVMRDGSRFMGWRRTEKHAHPDDAYTFCAVMALRSAKLSGIAFDQKIWNEVRSHYLERQQHDGSWTWVTQQGLTASRTPTVMALYGLYVCDEILGSTTGQSSTAIRKGVSCLVESLHFTDAEGTTFLYALSRLGQLYPGLVFVNATEKRRDWFDDGIVWIINHQSPSGWIHIPPFNSAKATASALLFLAAGK